jgi:curli biogenesis system outer membrane secretion channel CsgG
MYISLEVSRIAGRTKHLGETMLFQFDTTYRTSLNLVILLVSMAAVQVSARAENFIDATTQEATESVGVVLKRKVGIARFSNETQSGNTFLVDNSGDRLGKQAADILSARLADTGKFLMFERLDSDEVSAEQMMAGLKADGIGLDYLIVGSVSEFGRSTESDSGLFTRKKIQKAYSKVNVRLIDVSTGRIIFAAEGAGESVSEAKKTFGVGSSAGYDQSLTDKAISAAISQLTSNLVENMTNGPWRSYVLAQEDDLYIIAGGESQGLRPGTRLFVYENGRSVKNPQTGATIALPGKKVSTVEVVTSIGDDEFNELSFVSIIEGQLGSSFENYYVLDE